MSDHINEIEEAVRRALATDKERYIDVSRVPLICQSIIAIDKKLGDIKKDMVTQDQFWPVKTLVYSMVGLMLSALVGALVMLVLK